jgi:hypothetical protein
MSDWRQSYRILAEGPEDEAIYGAFVNALFGARSVFVQRFNGRGDITSETIATELKGSSLRALAIILDGDTNYDTGSPVNHWPKVRKALAATGYQDLPAESAPIPPQGLVIDKVPEGRPSCSLWVMPDNQAVGYLETFLWSTIEPDLDLEFPDPRELPAHLDALPTSLRKFQDVHRDKALFRTWLTWSREPDLRTANSIRRYFWERRRQLPRMQPFLNWLKRAFPIATQDSLAN